MYDVFFSLSVSKSVIYLYEYPFRMNFIFIFSFRQKLSKLLKKRNGTFYCLESAILPKKRKEMKETVVIHQSPCDFLLNENSFQFHFE